MKKTTILSIASFVILTIFAISMQACSSAEAQEPINEQGSFVAFETPMQKVKEENSFQTYFYLKLEYDDGSNVFVYNSSLAEDVECEVSSCSTMACALSEVQNSTNSTVSALYTNGPGTLNRIYHNCCAPSTGGVCLIFIPETCGDRCIGECSMRTLGCSE